MADDNNNWVNRVLMLLAAGALYLAYSIYDTYSTSGLLKHAEALEKTGQCMEAMEKLDRVIARDRTVADAHFLRGLCHYRAGEYDTAIADFSEVVRYRPTSPAAYYDRGLAQRQKGNDDAALADFESTIKLKPDDTNAHYSRGTILRERDRTDEAIVEYETAIRLKPDEVRYSLDRADTIRDKGNFTGAIAAYDDIIRVMPDEPAPYFSRAVTRRDMGDVDGALTELNAAIGRWSQIASGYLERGTILLFDTNRPAEAVEDIAKAVDMGFKYQGAMLLLDTGAEHFGIARTDYKYRLAPHTPYLPEAFYWTIRLHLARVRAGQSDGPELAKNADDIAFTFRRGLFANPHLPYWPNEILRLFQGLSTPDDVRAAAKSPKGATSITMRRRACDADFYLAEYQLEKGRREEARALLEAAAAHCPPSAPERSFARAELKRLAP